MDEKDSVIERDATPLASMIHGYINNGKFTLGQALCEMIDNSFDAQANQIRISSSEDHLSIWDNGQGCPDLQRMVRQGDRFESSDPDAIGRYGIGLKESSLWLAWRMDIESRNGGFTRAAHVDWERMLARHDWKFDEIPGKTSDGSSYTSIKFFKIHPNRLKGLRREIKNEVSLVYTPALKKGKTISWNGDAVAPVELPQLDSGFTDEGDYAGRPYRITAGLMHDPSRHWKPGYTLAFGNRIIARNQVDGTGEFSPRRFFAYVELWDSGDYKWALDRLKDGLVDQADFLDSLFHTCESLLKEDETKAHDLYLDRVCGEVSEEINLMISGHAAILEKRPGDGAEKGTKEGSDSGRKRQKAANSDPTVPGSVLNERHKRGTRISVQIVPSEMPDIGYVSGSRKTIIYLNKEHPLFANRPLRDVVLSNALALLTAFDMTHNRNGQSFLDFDEYSGDWFTKFSKAWGRATLGCLKTATEVAA